MARGKQKRSGDFKHFIWRRHEDRNAPGGFRPELIATDGSQIRRLISQPQHIVYQTFQDPDAARRVISRIEQGVGHGVPMLGYSMFADEPMVAILHTASGTKPGWLAFPFNKTRVGFPTLSLSSADQPSLRLVGGAALRSDAPPRISLALEQRGERFSRTDLAFSILEHVVGVKARLLKGEDDQPGELLDCETILENSDRLRIRLNISDALARTIRHQSDVELSIVVQFDRELMCLPSDWLSYGFRVAVTPPGNKGEHEK